MCRVCFEVLDVIADRLGNTELYSLPCYATSCCRFLLQIPAGKNSSALVFDVIWHCPGKNINSSCYSNTRSRPFFVLCVFIYIYLDSMRREPELKNPSSSIWAGHCANKGPRLKNGKRTKQSLCRQIQMRLLSKTSALDLFSKEAGGFRSSKN